MKKVFIDTDLFIRDLRYKRDPLFEINNRFLKLVKQGKIQGVTSVFNLLETCGILSFGYSSKTLELLFSEFPTEYNVGLLFPPQQDNLILFDFKKVFLQILKKQSLLDAQVSLVVNMHADLLQCFVSWNAKHFEEKLSIPVYTPAQFFEFNQ